MMNAIQEQLDYYIYICLIKKNNLIHWGKQNKLKMFNRKTKWWLNLSLLLFKIDLDEGEEFFKIKDFDDFKKIE